jgi:uroporphyrinogen-III synthase
VTEPGTRVVFTGAPGSLAGLEQLVAGGGVVFFERPLLSFGPPGDDDALAGALRGLEGYAAIAFTSPRAAESVTRAMRARELEPGSTTACWCSASCEPILAGLFPGRRTPTGSMDGGLGLALARAMIVAGVGSPILFPSGDVHREELPATLRQAGRVVHTVEAYRTSLADASQARAAIEAADVLVVTSPNVARLLAASGHVARPSLVALGPTTAHEAMRAGWAPDAVATSPRIADVAAAIHSLLPSHR